jgi:hypothetical protein
MRYLDLAADPVGAVRGVYDFAGIEFTPETESGVRGWLAANPADKHGRHTYALEDYGMTKERVQSVYADYIDTYRAYL